MWVNRKLRRDTAKALGRARVASLCRRGAANQDGCGECLSVTPATLCHARSRMALWCGLGGEWALSLRRCDVALEHGVPSSLRVLDAHSPQAVLWDPWCLNPKSSKKKLCRCICLCGKTSGVFGFT